MSNENRVRREPGNQFARTLAVLGSAAMLSLLTSRAYAFTGPSCVVCSGNNGNPSVTVGTGGLHHAEVVPIFWGSSWTPTAQAQVVAMIQQVVNGAYVGGLAQYGGNSIQVGPARMVPTAPIRAGTPVAHCNNGATCTFGSCTDGSGCGALDVLNMINATITAGVVPPPPANGGSSNSGADMLYVAFPPAGYTSNAANGFGFWNGRYYTFAWVPGNNPWLFTHELAEAIAGNAGVTNCGASNNQVADVCQCYTTQFQGGLQMAAYWSVAQNACVIPEGWDGVWRYNNAPNDWTKINTGVVRQVYAGGFGVAATDTSENLNLFNAGSGTWTAISGQGSQFAVSTSSIVRLSPAADNVSVYNGTPFNWSTIHGSRSAVYAGSRIVTTDFSGTEFSWLNSGDSWANIGKAGDEIVVTGTGRVYGIALDHSAVWMTPDNSGVWTQVGAASSELFAGLAASPAGTPLQPITSRDLWMYQGSGQSWLRQNGPGKHYAVAGSGPDLFMLNATNSAVLQSTNIHQTNPAWLTIRSGGFGKLVGSGNQLFAAGNPVF